MSNQVLGGLPGCSGAPWVHTATSSLTGSDLSTKAGVGFLGPLLISILKSLISVVSQVPVAFEFLEALPHSDCNSSPSPSPSPRPGPNNISVYEMGKQSRGCNLNMQPTVGFKMGSTWG